MTEPTVDNDKRVLFCGFCGRHRDHVRRIVAGRSACICDECILRAVATVFEDVLKEEERPVIEK